MARAPAADWRPVDADDLIVMRLATGAQVAIQLAPEFAPRHVANVRALIRAGRFDGGVIERVQDNYVVQWTARADAGPAPDGFVAHPPPEYQRPLGGLSPLWLPAPDSYAARAGFIDGWPAASDGRAAWLVHCYGMVGVGRDMPPDTGNGSELYAVIGQAPRHLDRNIALIGRVVQGIEALSALPRGTGDLGFYAQKAERVPIVRARLASMMPVSERPSFEVMRQDSASFARYMDARANRRDPFFLRPAGGVDVCNVPVPIRRTP